MSISAQPIPILSDNYAWLLRDSETGAIAIVDPAEDAPIDRALQHAGGTLDFILLTHHHADHTAAATLLQKRYGARIIGAEADARRLPGLDLAMADGDDVPLGGCVGLVFDTPGHTIGHVSYYFPDGGVLLCGDTLFSLGCGRLLEGTAADLFGSLQRLSELPDETLVCCGHEYTKSNAGFALSVDPDNLALRARDREVDRQLANGKPTLPARLGDERAANPFLRAAGVAEFADLRRRKDRF